MAQIFQEEYILGESSLGSISEGVQVVQLNLTLQNNTNSVTGASISGTVTNNTGQPIANAYIKLMTLDYVPFMHVVTDSTGEYTFSNVPAGSYSIFCISSGMLLNQGQSINVKMYENYVVNFQLTQDEKLTGSLITGLVTDSKTNQPIDDVDIFLFVKNSSPNIIDNLKAVVHTNKSGQYAICQLPQGTYTMVFIKLNYKIVSTTLSIIDNSQILQLNETMSTIIDLGILGGTVLGIINNKDNKPINNANVILYKVNADNNLTPVAFTSTNNDGVYAFNNVEQGKYKVKANEFEIVPNSSASIPSK